MYVCICNAVTERQVKECAQEGARSVDDLTAKLGVAAGCGRCRECAIEILREVCTGSSKKTPELSPACG
jgi:bacterioferritin-associated ferredoxin